MCQRDFTDEERLLLTRALQYYRRHLGQVYSAEYYRDNRTELVDDKHTTEELLVRIVGP